LSCLLLAAIYAPAVLLGIFGPRAQASPDLAPHEADAAGVPVGDRLERLITAPSPTPTAITAVAVPEPADRDPQPAAGAPYPAPPPRETQADTGELTAEPAAEPHAPPPPPRSVLEESQMVVFYGTPIASGLGILGMFEPEDAARRVRDQAGIFNELNGDRSAVGAMDLIYAMVRDEPTSNGLFLSYLPDATVDRYLRNAEEYDLQLILDLQVGRGDVVAEVRKIERFLAHPRVHVAVDPEYAVGPDGYPIHTPGRMSGQQINDIQDYLADLVQRHGLPPKMFVIHQYIDDTIVDGHLTRATDGVDLVLNMDAFGAVHDKVKKYRGYADLPYAQRDSFNIFLHHDERVLSEQEVLELQPEPDVVFYQ
jgi:hypothetical protein